MSERIVPLPADEVVPRALAGVFVYVPHGEKIRCATCGVSGYPPQCALSLTWAGWWGWSHREHVACPTCGERFTPRGGLAAHRRRLHGERGRFIGGAG